MARYEFGFIVPVFCERHNYFRVIIGWIMKVALTQIVRTAASKDVRVCLSAAVVSIVNSRLYVKD